jgi:aspartate aminotransferase
MTSQPISRTIGSLLESLRPFLDFVSASAWSQRLEAGDQSMCDFVAGNPHERPLPEFVAALQRWAEPKNKNWFAYKMSEPKARDTVVASLTAQRGIAFDSQDIFMTPGTFGAIAVSLRTICDRDDEVIFLSPPWFFYEAMILLSGATPVRVTLQPPEFDLDVDAIAAAITPRTRAVIVNTPQNPTGRIYPPEALRRLGSVLDEATERNGRAVYLLSDESYARILYDGNRHISPTEFYARAMLLYTYGKTLLTPGQRIGYIALPPTMPNREELRAGIFLAQIASGWAFPNALMQHALPDLEPLSIDLAHLQRKRDRMIEALRTMGYDLHVPQGTFYLLPRCPIPDDRAFADMLIEHDVFVLPGQTFELPGYFRISVTANDDMIERSLPGFESSLKQARDR